MKKKKEIEILSQKISFAEIRNVTVILAFVLLLVFGPSNSAQDITPETNSKDKPEVVSECNGLIKAIDSNKSNRNLTVML